MVFVESISEDHDTPSTRFLALMSQLHQQHYSDDDLDILRKAYEFANIAHREQSRVSGEPYVFHVISVAEILVSIKMDIKSIAASLLHDVLEDTEVTYDELCENFDVEIADLVKSVTKIKHVSSLSPSTALNVNETPHKGHMKHDLRSENLRKLILAMAKDIRVVMIKLADRLHNMRTLNHLPKAKQLVIAKETEEVYAPLANRLGIWQLKWELEDLAFRYLHPEQYKSVASHLSQRKVDRDRYIKDVLKLIREELEKNYIVAEVSGRSKHIYSIWKKMQNKNLGFHQLYDLSAIRILVDTVKDCYHALGVVHMLWKHIPMEFDDYIATPKGNNYQSIHTAVTGPQEKTLEIQIRTHEMHKHAEFGVAAHWRYKEGGSQNAQYEQKIAWLRQVLEWKDEQDAGDFIDRFKSEVFQDRVYVLTPAGELVDLPKGATPLDFAFYVHTEIGATCIGAKVNGRIVPLTYELHNGEQVEVLNKKNRIPSRDWLNPHLGYLKTARARSKVKSWFKQQNHELNVTDGKHILEKELQRLAVHNVSYEKISQKFDLQSEEELFVNIGRGDITSGQIAGAIERMGLKNNQNPPPDFPSPVQQAIDFNLDLKQANEKSKHRDNHASEVTIEGVDNVLSQIAHCCSPVPGDEIVGYITKSRGISIHRTDCHNIVEMSREQSQRLIDVQWNEQHSSAYSVDIEVIAIDRQGLLRDITTVLANSEINLLSVSSISNKSDMTAKLKLTIEIMGIEQLSSALNKLAQVSNVIESYRIHE
ncbi:MAG: GTP diphosphokinase [Gammaproteobacteria bacterium]|nr:GTP diphosphokinase [Gammaproteobacteria bacterium]